MAIIYFVVVISATVVAVFSSLYTQTDYKYIDKVSRENPYQLIHTLEKTSFDSHILKDKTNIDVFDYDNEHYLFVYRFHWDKINEQLTSLNIKTSLVDNQKILYVNIGNGKQDYKVLQENFVYSDSGKMVTDDKIPLSYYTYLNPKDDQLDIAIGYLALKEQDVEYMNDITFEFHTSYQYPYDKYYFENSRIFEHSHLVENGKLIY